MLGQAFSLMMAANDHQARAPDLRGGPDRSQSEAVPWFSWPFQNKVGQLDDDTIAHGSLSEPLPDIFPGLSLCGVFPVFSQGDLALFSLPFRELDRLFDRSGLSRGILLHLLEAVGGCAIG